MDVLKINAKTDSFGKAQIVVPTELKNSDIEMIIVVNSIPTNGDKKPVLSDFFGKMLWKGDALEEQRKLRNEWE
jgi:hypothetical protein